MKKVNYSGCAQERACEALDQIEAAFGVRTGLKAGGHHYGRGHNYQDPPVQALYGVVVATNPI